MNTCTLVRSIHSTVLSPVTLPKKTIAVYTQPLDPYNIGTSVDTVNKSGTRCTTLKTTLEDTQQSYKTSQHTVIRFVLFKLYLLYSPVPFLNAFTSPTIQCKRHRAYSYGGKRLARKIRKIRPENHHLSHSVTHIPSYILISIVTRHVQII